MFTGSGLPSCSHPSVCGHAGNSRLGWARLLPLHCGLHQLNNSLHVVFGQVQVDKGGEHPHSVLPIRVHLPTGEKAKRALFRPGNGSSLGWGHLELQTFNSGSFNPLLAENKSEQNIRIYINHLYLLPVEDDLVLVDVSHGHQSYIHWAFSWTLSCRWSGPPCASPASVSQTLAAPFEIYV